jgi:putative ABC transport system permease protein
MRLRIGEGKMNTLQCVAAVVWMNLRAVPQRLGSSLVMVVGIGGVVVVLVAVLAMVAGLVETMQNKGHPDRAIVLRSGSDSEIASALRRTAAETVMNAPEVKRDAQGKPLASMEALRLVRVVRSSNNAPGNVTLRGVGPQIAALRPELRIVAGRMFRPAVSEVIIGKGLAGQFKGLGVGSRVSTGAAQWTIVGVFESDGDPHESEMMTDVETLMSAHQLTDPNSVEIALQSGASFSELVHGLSQDPLVLVNVMQERDYYASQSRGINQLLAVLAYLVGSVMAVGAIFAGLNTMYSAVGARAREIATLRALGFGPAGIVISVLAEALLLGMAGGVVGAAFAWLTFDRMAASTVAGVGTQVVFHMAVTPAVMIAGLIWATGLGLVGGLLPAIRAARLPVAAALARS